METAYRVRVVCAENDQALIRAIVMRHINSEKGMLVQGIATQDCDEAHRTVVVADVFSNQRNDRKMEDLVSRLNLEPGMVAVSWEKRV